MTAVARVYRFAGVHSVPGLSPPWCDPHGHQYRVEVVARSEPAELLDTDDLDRAWEALWPGGLDGELDMDSLWGDTTVEALSVRWLSELSAVLPEVRRVTVWEDDSRWGSAEW